MDGLLNWVSSVYVFCGGLQTGAGESPKPSAEKVVGQTGEHSGGKSTKVLHNSHLKWNQICLNAVLKNQSS